MIKVGVIGAQGKMGTQIIKLLKEKAFPELSFSVGYTEEGQEPFKVLTHQTIMAADVLIDFTQKSTTLKLLPLYQEHKKPVVIGTTGFSKQDLEQLKKTSENCPLLLSPNMSIGVNVLFELVEQASRLLPDSFSAHLSETHHPHKKDAPSGTAVKIKEVVQSQRTNAPVPTESFRGGDVVGEHTLHFLGQGERIELKHLATDRKIFARGALQAAQWIRPQKPGFYSMKHVLKGEIYGH